MQTDFINLGLGFIEGFALIISPCILPILPIILAGSLTGSKKRPLGIITGFIITFALFTLFSRKLVEYSGIDMSIIRQLAYAILLVFGLTMLSTTLTERFAQATQKLAKVGSNLAFLNNTEGGFISGVLFGALVALIWTPCAGPILAAVIVQTVIQKTSFMSLLTLLAFGAGATVPMLLIALFGREIMKKFSFFKAHTNIFRKLLGLIILLSVAYMLYFEGRVPSALATEPQQLNSSALVEGLATPYPAPPIVGISDWINSPPLQISDLKGKVVLIDFWTYSCINCQRTLPYIKDWYDKYHNKGLVIIGVHTPEFDFEKDLSNVKAAVAAEGIQYPVALDNHFETWQSFNNRYWPAHYLIDPKGEVVYTHFGEGDYEITENNIRYLLGLHEPLKPTAAQGEIPSYLETPETYLGYARADRFASPEVFAQDQTATYSFPNTLAKDSWALQGAWTIKSEGIISAGNHSALKLHFAARHVYMVMGSTSSHPIHVKLLLNGKPILAEKGKNVFNSGLEVSQNTLYEVVLLDHFDQGILEVIPETPGLEVYTFTFGS